MPVGDLSGGEQARVRIAQLMLQPADLLLLDEPTNDLDIPALEVLEDSLAEFPGALVLVSHDRELMDRLCTEVVGLDGRGGAALYGSVGQWLTAYERRGDRGRRSPPRSAAPAAGRPPPKPRKLSYRSSRSGRGWRRPSSPPRKRRRAPGRGRGRGGGRPRRPGRGLPGAGGGSDSTVERLYARWQELEAKRSP